MGAVIIASYGESAPPATTEQQARIRWVGECLRDFNALKLGMTRTEVETVFPQYTWDIHSFPTRIIHPDCPLFMIDVDFDVKGNPEDHNRATPSPEDLVTNISKPYIAFPVHD